MSTDGPLTRTVLREQVKDLILERVLDGTYAPGSRLVETRIASELHISQAPVREALRDLAQLGVVVHEPFRGCSVRELSIDELLEGFPVRAALEALAAELAAANITAELLARLEELVADMRRGEAAGDQVAVSTADAAFHATIVDAAANRTLERQWSQLQPRARTLITLSLPPSARGGIADRHLPIVEALRRRDAQAAAAAMRDHLEDAGSRLRLLSQSHQETT